MSLSAQRTQRVFSSTVSPGDWDITSISSVRFGRIAVINQPQRSSLSLRMLLDSAPSTPPHTVRSAAPPVGHDHLVVGAFAESNQNALGGYFNTFYQTPSTGDATVASGADGRRALHLRCRREGDGFCGLWIQLYDFERPQHERTYLDAREFATLSFWIRGHQGGERLLLKVADAQWELREDALPIGQVGEFLPSGQIETEWQRVIVPLHRFPTRVSLTSLAMIVLEATSVGSTDVDIDMVTFSRTHDDLPSLPEPHSDANGSAPPYKATWIWDTADLMDEGQRWAELLTFLEREAFTHVFLQLPDGRDRRGVPGEISLESERLRPLVGSLNRLGIRVYALDGNARYALPEYHAGVLATIQHVMDYNRTSGDDGRFFGIRHDIEPYLLPGFHGPRREVLLKNLLELVAASAALARTGGLQYGVDIPFWYDAPDTYSHQPVTVQFRGKRRPVSQHIIDLADDIAVMDYRTRGYGADGTVRHATHELAYATQVGTWVFVGLETYPIPDELVLDFGGPPHHGLPRTTAMADVVILAPRGDSLQVFLVAAGAEKDSPSTDDLGTWFEQQGLDPDALWWWPVVRGVHVPGDKISFARLGVATLSQVMEETALAFSRYESFAGFALHSAASYQRLAATVRR